MCHFCYTPSIISNPACVCVFKVINKCCVACNTARVERVWWISQESFGWSLKALQSSAIFMFYFENYASFCGGSVLFAIVACLLSFISFIAIYVSCYLHFTHCHLFNFIFHLTFYYAFSLISLCLCHGGYTTHINMMKSTYIKRIKFMCRHDTKMLLISLCSSCTYTSTHNSRFLLHFLVVCNFYTHTCVCSSFLSVNS